MSVIGSNILAGASGQGGAYNLTNSLRFRSSASAYLNRTPASASNRTTWTWSGWLKSSVNSSNVSWLFAAGTNGTTDTGIYIATDFTLQFYNRASSSINGYILTPAVFRDPSSWYHIVATYDASNATATDRMILYVNGVRQTVTVNTQLSLGTNSAVNNNVAHQIGSTSNTSSPNLLDGYLAEVNFIDGQALTPSSFGETSATTGVWIPKKYTGTYGTNGFYLPFTNTASTSTLGNDFSGNSNTWTVNNISLTAGTTYDSMTDVPTLTSATAANYCVMNPLRIQNVNIAAGTLSDGNLKITTSASDDAYSNHYGTMAFPTTGKWYFEAVFAGAFGNDAGNYAGITGVSNGSAACTIVVTSTTVIQKNFSNVQTGLSFVAGDILGVAFDATNLTVDFYKNGSAFGSQVTGLDSVEYTPFILASNPASTQSSWTLNFGQRPFAYTPPSGFIRLNTFNLPTPTIGATASTLANKYFNAITYTGNGGASSNTTQNITTNFYPDLTWVKGRDSSFYHRLTSTGLTQPNYLSTNSTDTEGSLNDQISALASTYFQVKAAGSGGTNQSGLLYVGWAWNANSGSTVSNTNGSITSTVSVNPTSGFSIVTYTGNGSSPVTIGHGLGVTPAMIILKDRDATSSWMVKHQNMSSNKNIFLEDAGGEVTAGNGYIQNLSSTTTFGVINGGSGVANVNTNNNDYVAYCFAQVAGYSAFGKYTGNGVPDGTFIFTGFRPRYLMIKSLSAESWELFDTSRSPYNQAVELLEADYEGGENTSSTSAIDILSNGFKQRNTRAATNGSGTTYIYMAFAESPFRYANAR